MRDLTCDIKIASSDSDSSIDSTRLSRLANTCIIRGNFTYNYVDIYSAVKSYKVL